MRKLFWLLPAALVLSCNSVGENEFVLNGSVANVADGKNVILEKNDEAAGLVAVDTVKIKDGKFTFEGKAGEPQIHSIAIEGVPSKSYVVIENGEIDIQIVKDSVFQNKISGTYNNEQLTEFNAIGAKLQKKIKDFEVKNKPALVAAQQSKDTTAIKKLQADYSVLQKEMENSTYKYIEDHPKSYIAALLLQSMFNAFEPDTDRIKKFYAAMDNSIKKSKLGRDIEKKINDFKLVNVGRPAPDFSAASPDGKTISLKQSMGKLTIIDFWASWCGPCRKANPELVALYNEFHPQGLNIISVSLDKPGQADRWKQAIADDKMTWTHVSNLMEWKDPIAATYGVQAIPAMFLVNERGIVVAKDLHGEQLATKVRQFLTGKK